MKVIIGPYKRWIGPYQLADMVFWWQKKYDDDCVWADRAHRFGTWLSEKKDGSDTWLLKLCNWVQDKRQRQVYVRIDHYDTYSMDHTLSYMIVPMLKQLKATKHGAPWVDDEDVPDSLKSTNADPKGNDWDTDSNHFLRWDYILDEMIWAFSQQLDDEADTKFYTHAPKVAGEELDSYIHRMQVDEAGLKAWSDRKRNGYRLFGKYYEALWD